MSDERLQQAFEIFERALQVPAEQREAFLRTECGGNAALQREVESLLAHDAGAGVSFMRADQPSPPKPSAERTLDSLKPRLKHNEKPPPPTIDGYTVLTEAGHGGMGIVYLARDERLDRLVAIKTLAGGFESEDRLRILRREAQLAAKLRHQNIVAIHSLIESSVPPCVVMEWVDGVPLNAIAQRLSFQDTAALVCKVAKAVAYAHSIGVVHRDLKPGNILVDRAGEPRLLDFGLARAMMSPFETTSVDAIRGTPLFMAPEQFLTPSEVGPAADIFALGVVLFVMLTASNPPSPGQSSSVADWANREIPLPRERNPDIPEALQRICLKACDPDVEHRYASAAQLVDDLERFLQARPVLARPRRYARLLDDRVRTHIDAIGEWQTEQLISRHEADSLEQRYLRLIRAESLWVPGARRLRLGAVLLQAGGWLVVMSTILWPVFYWDRLSSAQKIMAIGFPTIAINAAALMLWTRSSQLVAIIFTILGQLLIPVFLVVLLSEFHIPSTRSPDPDRFELLPEKLFNNRQIFASFATSTLCALWWVNRRRFAALSATACLFGLLAIASVLLLFGLKYWVTQEWFAGVAAAFAVVPLLSYWGATRLDHPGTDHLSVPPYIVAGVSFVAICATIAYDAPESWFDLRGPSGPKQVNLLNVTRELLFLGVGVICFLIAVVHDRASTRLRRLWGSLYFKLVPPALVLPVDLMAEEPSWNLGEVGGADFRVLSLGVPFLCVLFIIAGTRLQLRWYTYYGLLHLAVFVVRTTSRHFHVFLSWPMAVGIVGALVMLVGLWMEHRHSVARSAVGSAEAERR